VGPASFGVRPARAAARICRPAAAPSQTGRHRGAPSSRVSRARTTAVSTAWSPLPRGHARRLAAHLITCHVFRSPDHRCVSPPTTNRPMSDQCSTM
jgi:hypothetical protein